jgi:signal transduction histidine kinase
VEGTRFAERYREPSFLEGLHGGQVQVLDLTKPPYLEQRPLVTLQQALVVPIHLGGILLGVVSLNQEARRTTYTFAELALAQGIGRLAGLILERERLLREREEARAQALASEETTRRMDEFLTIASHELRTPVTSIKTNLQLLLKQAQRIDSPGGTHPAAPQVKFSVLQRSEGQLRRLTRLLDDLLDLSRIRAGKLEFHLAACDLSNVVAEVVEDQRLVVPRRTITLALPTRSTVPVYADADRIGQVVLNYLTNALKYSPADQLVAVRVDVDGQTVKVSVQDAGPGIPPAEQGRLWELFHRVPGIEVQSGSGIGLGLGLYISKTIIERHQGQVGVESAPGQGATFWFTLPLAAEE